MFERTKSTSFTKRFLLITYGLFILTAVQLKIVTTYGDISLLNYSDNTASRLFIDHIFKHFTFALPMMYFIMVETCLHLCFVIYTYILYSCLSSFYRKNFYSYSVKWRHIKTYVNFTALLFLNYCCLLIINDSNFPNSAFELKNFVSNKNFLDFLSGSISYMFAIVWLSTTFLMSLIYIVKKNIKSQKVLLTLLLTSLGLILISQYDLNNLNHINFFKTQQVSNQNLDKPNVVLITIDSMRQDHVKKIHPLNNKNLDIPSFYNQAIKFENAYTPLARSFPALYSVLSGHHPKDDNIRFNLVGQKDIDFVELLPSVLQKQGYETLYTTDSNQFHIITREWGYTHVAAPTAGIYEQIIPTLSDFPLSNLILDYKISKYLFPYTYANQSQSRLYNPLIYTQRLKSAINQLDRTKPVFLHLNFEAAHWPYNNRYLDPKLMHQERYLQCLNTANWQINQVFEYLNEKNLLDNTLVIMISDHGEALSISNDKLTNYNNYVGEKDLLKYMNKAPVNYTYEEVKNKNILDIILNINTSGGHGVDVLSSTQYKVAFGIQYFKNSKATYPSSTVLSNVGLQDIYPTITEFLNVDSNHQNKSNSMSIMPLFKETSISQFDERHLFIETDLYVPYFDTNEVHNKDIFKSLINKWSKFYYINDKNYLELKAESIAPLLKTKQYAVIINKDILAYIPNGIKEQWSLITNDAELSTIGERCEIPRPLTNNEGGLLGMLCGYYSDLPGYYVYYDGQNNNWTLFKNEQDLKNNQSAQSLHSNLINYYKTEISSLVTPNGNSGRYADVEYQHNGV